MVRIPDVPSNIVRPIMNGFSKLGISIETDGECLIVDGSRELIVQPDRGGSIPTVYDAPWPGFSPDLTSTAVVVATQARGTTLVFEKMFESRLFFVDKLVAMGAAIIQCDPHRVVVSGPSRLHGTDEKSPLQDTRQPLSSQPMPLAQRKPCARTHMLQAEVLWHRKPQVPANDAVCLLHAKLLLLLEIPAPSKAILA